MSWLSLAVGLIREAATTQTGQDIISDIRSTAFKGKQGAPDKQEDVGEWRQSVEARLAVGEKNAEMLVQMLNAQDEAMIKIQKRQRIWNVALAVGMLVAIALVFLV
jgi:hypothetical protein